MSGKNNNLSASLTHLSRGRSARNTGSIAGSTVAPNQVSLAAGSPRDSHHIAGIARQATPLAFGHAHLHPASIASGTDWAQMLTKVATGGIGSFLGGGDLFSIGGIKSLVSGLEGLFGGGKSTPPPLTAFQLPASQNQSITIGSAVSSLNLQDHSAAVAQAVKTALLHSSSLADVIAEI